MTQDQLADHLRQLDIDPSSLSFLFGRGQQRVYGLGVPGAGAIELWGRLRDQSAITGYWPVLGWGGGWDSAFPEAYVAYLPGAWWPDEIVAESIQVDPIAWLRRWSTEHPELVRGAPSYGDGPQAEFWIVESGQKGGDDADKASTLVPLALIPTVDGWQVPAYLSFVDPDPPPAVHVALARRWNDLYGAEIVVMLPNMLKMRVPRPPKTLDEARTLVEEHALYLGPGVPRKTQVMESMAIALLQSSVWTFWWY